MRHVVAVRQPLPVPKGLPCSILTIALHSAADRVSAMQDGLTRAEKYKLLVHTLRRAAEHIIGSVATALGLFMLAFSAPAAATDFGQSSGLTDAGNTYKFYSRESASVSPTGKECSTRWPGLSLVRQTR